MRITELNVYPVKGAAPVPVTSWQLDSFGLEHDRRWMAIDDAGLAITQRDEPLLGWIRPELVADALILRSQLAGELRLPLAPQDGAPVTVTIWGDTVAARDAGDPAAAFLEMHLGRAARLVYMPDATLRQADTDYARAGDRVSFADGFPLLLIAQASLDELNRRLAEPVPMLRFRPNIVVDGTAPHEEDTWRSVRLGAIECDVVKPCARCVVTTVDAATATPGREPLSTLADYRRWNGKVWFGQNVIHRGTGNLSVGDTVTVLDTGTTRPPLHLMNLLDSG